MTVERYEKQIAQLQMLLQVSQQVASTDTLDEMLKQIVGLATEQTRSDRGSIFLHDAQTGELYTRYAQGEINREIRILSHKGISGYVFTHGEGVIIHDAYASEHFDSSVDKETGYKTENILCSPIRTVRGQVIGVIQVLNKREGRYDEADLKLLEAITAQATVTLQNAQNLERLRAERDQEMNFLDIVSDITSEINIDNLLQKVVSEATAMLKADRGTLFLNDTRTNELFSRVVMGGSIGEIRLPNHVGIAGAVFTSGKTINIPYAYADLRFNPAFDKKTGYFTRSILCVPVSNKDGRTIGVTQVLNKKGGTFTSEDESRLKAFTAQVSIALENAKLFEDVQNIKNYNESMLESMTNGVITMNEHNMIVTCNAAGLRILGVTAREILKVSADAFFADDNSWIMDKIAVLAESHAVDSLMDVDLICAGKPTSVNLTFLPLLGSDKKQLGSMIMIEDISSEKRMKSTMSRYMDAGIANQLMEGGEDLLGGRSVMATVLFSDIRSFTTLTESLGPQGTVQMLNEYFTIMVDCIQKQGGMLDKFIGDAMMAGFGLPISHGDDEDRGVRAAIDMIVSLNAFNQQRAAKGLMPILMGIGLNTDTVVSGNIGSPKRMDYTMIGDGVNLAARLESACKQYYAQILISENTVKRLKGTYRMRDIDWVVVKGKTQPVAVYEVLDYHTEETFPNLMEVVNHFGSGIQHYRAGRFEAGIHAFTEALRRNPNDKLSQSYIDRCNHMIAHPPEGPWDGVWVMTSK
ncbi:MAG: GAF domain-containing protein [Magnetococcales bacterium]|nr:GAF domain-containing protein [Magnetococcales bacterium]MBF0584649.1 GAF domain-containing protein [Magnetococcales bacterium]